MESSTNFSLEVEKFESENQPIHPSWEEFFQQKYSEITLEENEEIVENDNNFEAEWLWPDGSFRPTKPPITVDIPKSTWEDICREFDLAVAAPAAQKVPRKKNNTPEPTEEDWNEINPGPSALETTINEDPDEWWKDLDTVLTSTPTYFHLWEVESSIDVTTLDETKDKQEENPAQQE